MSRATSTRGAALALAPALVLALSVTLPRAARADQGELALSLGLTTLQVTASGLSDGAGADDLSVARLGLLAHAGLTYSLTDYWQLAGIVEGGVGLLDTPAPEGLVEVLVDGRFVIDALTWVPYLSFGGGLLLRGVGPDAYYQPGGAGPRLDATVHVGLGVDYRPRRAWALGAVARYHLVLTDLARTTGPIALTLTGSLFF